MAIISTDIQYRLSGGAGNSDPAASLGGAKSSVTATNYFDDVSSAEATSGDVEYRCIYVHNNHGTLTLIGSKIWIQTNTPSSDTTVEGYSSLLNGPAQAAGSVVRQRVHNGYDGADYQVRCVASDGIETYVLTATLPVRVST